MKNKLVINEDLKEHHSNGEMSYKYFKYSDDCSFECTYNESGNILTYKNSEGDSWERTYDENGNILTLKYNTALL